VFDVGFVVLDDIRLSLVCPGTQLGVSKGWMDLTKLLVEIG
jgi:hypothetical protein